MNAAVQPPSNGSSPIGCRVVSNANTTEVPRPSAIDHDTNLRITNASNTVFVKLPARMFEILSYPTPSVRGSKYPITPTTTAPIAGNHIQCTGNFSNPTSI